MLAEGVEFGVEAVKTPSDAEDESTTGSSSRPFFLTSMTGSSHAFNDRISEALEDLRALTTAGTQIASGHASPTQSKRSGSSVSNDTSTEGRRSSADISDEGDDDSYTFARDSLTSSSRSTSKSSGASVQSLPSMPDAPTTHKQPKSREDRSKDETPVIETWDEALPCTGSKLHEVGMVWPCVFEKQFCVSGADCGLCHFAYPKESETRPCIGRTERFRKQMSRMENMIFANLDIDQSSTVLPHALQGALLAATQQAGEGSQEVGSTPAQNSSTSVSL